MPEAVTRKRRYDSSRRRAQTESTRNDILAAAQRLFERHGYAATTMEAIAAEAGVALKTVYVAFETKSGLLRALWNHLLRGGQDDVPIGEQQWHRRLVAEQDAERQIRMTARNSRLVKIRIAGVLEVIRSAAPLDPEIAGLWRCIQRDFHANQGVIVESLQAKRALRAGLSAERATDILWTLNHPNLWQLLVEERGWTPEQYEAWLFETARAQLLG